LFKWLSTAAAAAAAAAGAECSQVLKDLVTSHWHPQHADDLGRETFITELGEGLKS